MATPVHPFGSIERALIALLARDLPHLDGTDSRVGTEFPRDLAPEDFAIRIDRVASSTDSFSGDFTVDLEVFSQDYLKAEGISLDIEALMLAHGYHVVITDGRRWVFDDVSQNDGVADLPWDGDDDTYRLGATYVLTSRRGPQAGTTIPAAPGSTSAARASYTHTQTEPAAIWTIPHGLGYPPGGVRVDADNGDTYFPVVVDLDTNTVRLTMAEPITGKAYLS